MLSVKNSLKHILLKFFMLLDTKTKIETILIFFKIHLKKKQKY